MKICAIICEYNPFHNGHLYQLRQAKTLSGADAVVCVMSGNFVQRGEAAILDKYTRAKHAVWAGADAVIELPVAFATSNAEIFAKGAIQLLHSIPSVKTLCFGAEKAEKLAFISAAKCLNEEPPEVSEKIKQSVSEGASYAKARAQAFAGFIPFDLLSSPNNILGLEYTKAVLSSKADISILPIKRIGGGYVDERLYQEYSSATAIRAALQRKEIPSGNLPDFVKEDLPCKVDNTSLELLEKYAILARSTREIAQTLDCTEGLENALKRAAEQKESLVNSLTSPRYTSSRIRRIALQNLLQISKKEIFEYLASPLYLRVLAVRKGNYEVLSALSQSAFPSLTHAHDEEKLCDCAKKCFEKDVFADRVYGVLYGAQKSNNIFIE